ncbi:heat shock protein transcriptional repressor HspR [Gephyromycinifex aptenodytis]|uniref:heat shock protein transcriptional repressor HspR n=1 Tax=Gephyromycinifex aptenodytis TaxID=2716227 RepID=UPI00144631DA|nr:helix-turn-helix transcriptional regulator [Gephyromycinifex aptenodytis]
MSARSRRDAAAFTHDDDTPVFVISVAAQLAGMHAQTLRQYDRLGLVIPARTRGGGRRYSNRDIARLREVQRLSQEEGVSLPGIQRILQLENEVHDMRAENEALRRRVSQLTELLQRGSRVFAAGRGGDVVAVPVGQRPHRSRSESRALVLWRPHGGR